MNEALRNYVTSTSFSLTMRRTHIEALIRLDHTIAYQDASSAEFRAAYERAQEEAEKLGFSLRTVTTGELQGLLDVHYHGEALPPNPGNAPSFWYVASGALARRGLVALDDVRARKAGATFGEAWRITEAGRLVVGLLKEAGIWQEYAATLLGWPAREASGAVR